MHRTLVEVLYSTFSRKIYLPNSNAKSSSSALDHSLIEGDTCRYLFQPLDNIIFLVLITLPTSNIVLDFQNLRSLASIISSIGGEKDRISGVEGIMRHLFYIINCIDEAFLPLSIPDPCSSSLVQSALDMYSQTEKLEELVIRDKERETKEKAKEKLKQLETIRREKQLEANRREKKLLSTAPKDSAIPSSHSHLPTTFTDSPPSSSTSILNSPITKKPTNMAGGGMQLFKKKPTIQNNIVANNSNSIDQQLESVEFG